MISVLRNKNEFEICLWHSHCKYYAIQDGPHSLILQRQSPKPLRWFEISIASWFQGWETGVSLRFVYGIHIAQITHFNMAAVRQSKKNLPKIKASALIWMIICISTWFQGWETGVSLRYVDSIHIVKIIWFTMLPFADRAKFWKSEKNLSKPKAYTLIWAIISYCT